MQIELPQRVYTTRDLSAEKPLRSTGLVNAVALSLVLWALLGALLWAVL